MAPKLSDLLFSEGLLTPQQLEEALQSQVIYGGRLGTNLVEMNMVKETDVIRCLSKLLERPFVSAEQLMSVPPGIIELIPKEVAEKFKIIPVSLEKRRLTVAMLQPSDLAAIDAISFMTGYTILPVVSSELRILQALENYYGIKREIRFINLSGVSGSRSRSDVPPDPVIKEEVVPDWFDHLNTSPVVVPEVHGTYGDRSDSMSPERNRTVITEIQESDPGLIDIFEEAENPGLDECPPEQLPTAVHSGQLDPLSQEVPGSVLTVTSERDAIAKAVADYIYQNAENIALFMVQGGMAAGLKARIRKKVVEGFESFQLPLDELSALKVVADTGNSYIGPITETAGTQKLFAALGRGVPAASTLLIPLMMMGRVVMIFYLDAGKELAKDLESLQKTADLADLASDILQPLLLQ